MTPRRRDIEELRALGMALLDAACSKRRMPAATGLDAKYVRLRGLAAQISTMSLNGFYRQELDFAKEILDDPKVKRISKPKLDRSVWTVSVPFETNRQRH